MILATASHTSSSDEDTNYFLDADMSILGMDHEQYLQYTKDIRNEYMQYNDEQFREGRKKVLEGFLEMDRIFKTDVFYQRYEEVARMNIKREIESLGGTSKIM